MTIDDKTKIGWGVMVALAGALFWIATELATIKSDVAHIKTAIDSKGKVDDQQNSWIRELELTQRSIVRKGGGL